MIRIWEIFKLICVAYCIKSISSPGGSVSHGRDLCSPAFLVIIITITIIIIDRICFVVCSAIMRLSNELVYGGALQCANDDVAHATLHTSVSQKQVCSY